MLKILKEIFLPDINKSNDEFSRTNQIQIATCALLLEVANSDDHFSSEEKSKLIEIMKNVFLLNSDQVSDLIEVAKDKIAESISLYEFTNTLNQNLTYEEKKEILKNLWRLIFADNIMDVHEEYIIRKISKTLNLYHQDFIETKILVKEELGIS